MSLHLAHQLVGRHLSSGPSPGWSRSRSANTASRSMSGGNAPRSRRAASWPAHVAGGAEYQEPQERQPLGLVEPAGDAEVEQRGAAVGLHARGCRRAGRRGRRRRSTRPRATRSARPAASRRVSMPAACIDSTSSNAKPRSRSITSTRRVTSVGCGPRHDDRRAGRSSRARRRCRACSRPRGGSRAPRRSVSANSSTSAGGLASAAIGIRPMSAGASHDSAAMSSRTSGATCGRCTLTTTSSPVMSRAACTCAIDAAAIGSSSNEREQVLERAAEVDLDDGPDVVERLGRHLVAAAA